MDCDAENVTPAPTSIRALLTDIHTDSEELQSPTTTPLAEEGTGSCDICGYTEDEGIVGFGLGMALPAGDILWVSCEKCLKWFHLLCLGVEEEDLPAGDWRCGKC